MIEVIEQINAVRRRVARRTLDAGEAHSVIRPGSSPPPGSSRRGPNSVPARWAGRTLAGYTGSGG
jgi:hypothetical protein